MFQSAKNIGPENQPGSWTTKEPCANITPTRQSSLIPVTLRPPGQHVRQARRRKSGQRRIYQRFLANGQGRAGLAQSKEDGDSPKNAGTEMRMLGRLGMGQLTHKGFYTSTLRFDDRLFVSSLVTNRRGLRVRINLWPPNLLDHVAHS